MILSIHIKLSMLKKFEYAQTKFWGSRWTRHMTAPWPQRSCFAHPNLHYCNAISWKTRPSNLRRCTRQSARKLVQWKCQSSTIISTNHKKSSEISSGQLFLLYWRTHVHMLEVFRVWDDTLFAFWLKLLKPPF